MKRLIPLAVLALVALAAPTSAQTPTDITVTPDSLGELAYLSSGTLGFTARVGCLEFLTNSGGMTATVTVTDAPTWMTVEDATVTFSATDCPTGQGFAEETGGIAYTLSDAAPAVVSHTINLKATIGSTSSADTPATFTVAYNSNYTMTPSVTFPLEVTNKTTTFTVTGVQASNAPSMIMVDGFSADSGALVSGIGPLQYMNEAGKADTKTYTVTFTAPTGDWEVANVTLQVYGHYNFPDGSGAGDPTDQKTITWQFVNGGVHDDHGKESKKSPAPVGLLTALGLVAFAALRRKD